MDGCYCCGYYRNRICFMSDSLTGRSSSNFYKSPNEIVGNMYITTLVVFSYSLDRIYAACKSASSFISKRCVQDLQVVCDLMMI